MRTVAGYKDFLGECDEANDMRTGQDRRKSVLSMRKDIMLNISLRLVNRRKTTTGEIERESLSGRRNTMMREGPRDQEKILRE